MDAATRIAVRKRAGNRCEYCQRSQAASPLAFLQIEHVIPRKHGGTDDFEISLLHVRRAIFTKEAI